MVRQLRMVRRTAKESSLRTAPAEGRWRGGSEMPRPPLSVPLRPAYGQAIDGVGACGVTDALGLGGVYRTAVEPGLKYGPDPTFSGASTWSGLRRSRDRTVNSRPPCRWRRTS